jgi:dihydroorotase
MPPPPTRRNPEGAPTERREDPSLVLAGRAWIGGRLRPVEIAIGADGRIASVGRVRTGAPRHDVGDSVILPAATDLHVHFRDPPGIVGVEDFASGTVSAAIGGVGLVGEMPNTVPPVLDADAVRTKGRRASGRVAVDVLLYAEPTAATDPGTLARSAGAFKLYLSPTTGFDRPPRLADVGAHLRRLAACALPVSVHAEDPTHFAIGGAPKLPRDWDARRPPDAELAAIDALAGAPASLRLNIAHVTTAEAARRARGIGAACEVTPHHLLLSERSGSDARFKVNPPLRSDTERRALWESFRRGEVPMVASDHAPHGESEKALPFAEAPSGVPGVETMLPLLLARVRAGELDLATLLAAACDRPARWFGQPIGRIAPGHRANLLVIDFRRRTTIEGRHLHSACGWTPFEGWEGIFPREHYRDGERIVADGEYVGSPAARVVRPEFALSGPPR